MAHGETVPSKIIYRGGSEGEPGPNFLDPHGMLDNLLRHTIGEEEKGNKKGLRRLPKSLKLMVELRGIEPRTS